MTFAAEQRLESICRSCIPDQGSLAANLRRVYTLGDNCCVTSLLHVHEAEHKEETYEEEV